jgi:DNA-directed RNA polymerase specialized sigma24 family protein
MKFPDLPRSEIENLIDEWILNKRDRYILKRRLLDGIKFEDLAEEVEMSVRQVKSIVYKCEQRLFTKVGKR